MKHVFILIYILAFMTLEAYGKAAQCPPGQYLVRSHYRRGYTRSDGSYVRATNVRSYCKLLTKAYEFSKEHFKNGMPPNWPHTREKISTWTANEKEQVTDALEELPDILLSDKINGIYRLKKSKDYPNPASNAKGIIVLYDSGFESNRNLGQILAHELSHQNYGELSETERQDYRRATGWKMELEPNGIVYWTGRKDGYIEEDGKNSHEEDYANNLEHYLYNPDKLKKVTPTAYDWIKKRFGDTFKLKGGKK